MSAGDRDMLADLLRDALFQQPDAIDDWHSPWVNDDATPAGRVQVDGDLDLNILADVLLGSDWLQQVKAGAWDEGYDARDNHDFRYLPGCENPYRTLEDTDVD